MFVETNTLETMKNLDHTSNCIVAKSNEPKKKQINFTKDSFYKSECGDSIAKEGTSYRIKLPKGLCLTTFIVDGKFFRLTSYGFEKVLVY
jgi:hypothetical protein